MNLLYFFDTSGSMNEMGKIHLQKNLCCYAAQLKTIDQEKYENINNHFYKWAQNISEITVQSDGDIASLIPDGISSLKVLFDFLSKNLDEKEIQRVLILSDGNFSNSDILSFHNQLSSFSDLIIRTVAVGADADLFKLKKISTNSSVYLSENIATAIDGTLFGIDEQLTAPASIAQIMQSEPAESEEPEEDWDA